MNNCRQIISVFTFMVLAVLCLQSGIVFGEEERSSPLDLNQANKILNEEGAEKAYVYIFNSGHGHGHGGSDARFLTFFAYIASGNSDWFQVLTRMASEPLESEQIAVNAVAEAVAEHPRKVFEYWHEVLPKNEDMIVNCTDWDSLIDPHHYYEALGSEFGIGAELKYPFYITMPMYRGILEKRREAAKTIDDKKLQIIKNECVEQIDSSLALFKIKYEDKLGFISNEKGKYTYSNKGQNHWYNEAALLPLNWDEMLNQVKREDTYKVVRDSEWYSNLVYFLVEDTSRWPSLMAKIASANNDWLVFLKESESSFYEGRRIDRDLALGLAITKDPKTVFSVMKEVLSKGNELKNVCGNTYEDLLWGVAVEEQVIGAAVEKLEARKKSINSIKDKSLSDMKRQCIQAVDNSLAMWKGRLL